MRLVILPRLIIGINSLSYGLGKGRCLFKDGSAAQAEVHYHPVTILRVTIASDVINYHWLSLPFAFLWGHQLRIAYCTSRCRLQSTPPKLIATISLPAFMIPLDFLLYKLQRLKQKLSFLNLRSLNAT